MLLVPILAKLQGFHRDWQLCMPWLLVNLQPLCSCIPRATSVRSIDHNHNGLKAFQQTLLARYLIGVPEP